jgi:TetR/AcrR family transcriptional regulator, mexJK operon transcriptional repressor
MGKGTGMRMERTRNAILKAAAQLFLRDGYLCVSMDGIAEAAAVSKQTIYAHFQSKDGLFLEFVQSLTGEAGDEIQDRVSGPPFDRSLKAFLLDFARQQLNIVLTPELMQLRRLAIGEAGRFPELGIMLHKMGPARSINRLELAFQHYRADSQLAAADLHEAASNFNWLMMGGPVNDAMMLGDDAIPGQEKLERHANECVRVFLAAYATSNKT